MDIRELEKITTDLKKGSDAGISKQHNSGKLTARERIARLVDSESFSELGMFVKHRAVSFGMADKDIPLDGVITGYARIANRPVYIAAQDFTVSGGTLGEMHAQKIAECQQRAMDAGVPIIFVNDSGGARIQEGVDALSGFGRIFHNAIKASGVIPQISIISGPCAGGAVYAPALTDFIFVTDKVSKMFITGPNVIKEVTGEDVDFETLGGADTQSRISGVAHFRFHTEDECYEGVKKLLSYLPDNNLDDVRAVEYNDDDNRFSDALDSIIPSVASKPYDIKEVIRQISDDGDFFEYSEFFAPNIVTCFARIGGTSVGIVANQPMVYAGSLDCDASDKASRFVRTCDAFNIPLITLVDVPGFLPGVKEEHKGIIRHGAKLLYSYSEAVVPKITIILRKAYGGAYIAMCSKSLGADFVYAWPGAEIAVMGAEGAVGILYAKELKNDSDGTYKAQKISEYKKEFMSPLVAAQRGIVDDIIMPSVTRKRIISALQLLKSKKAYKIQKKHGNMPL